MINPTIGIEIGATYVFDQSDRTNYYHPIGFAYYPDGDHAGMDELEPGIQPYGSSSDCALNKTCPAPMYLRDRSYLGMYSNIADVLEPTTGESNFGLDFYEPLFYRPLPEWSNSSYSVLLKFDVEDFQNDIFYFCHIHQFMTGRIKLLKNGVPVTHEDVPEVSYTYDAPSEFDEKCGTYGLDQFQLPNEQCFDRFVCNVPSGDSNLELFSECIEAMNCAMLSGMTTKASSGSEIALFIHHMIPHHQNAVNMAKATLKFGKFQCDDLTSETDDCVLEQILREIVNDQNFQIQVWFAACCPYRLHISPNSTLPPSHTRFQVMYGVLAALGYPKSDDCYVKVSNGQAMDDDNLVLAHAGDVIASGDDIDGRYHGKKGMSRSMSKKSMASKDSETKVMKGKSKNSRPLVGHDRWLSTRKTRGTRHVRSINR
jgi:Domain of unknown function (DUF305)